MYRSMADDDAAELNPEATHAIHIDRVFNSYRCFREATARL